MKVGCRDIFVIFIKIKKNIKKFLKKKKKKKKKKKNLIANQYIHINCAYNFFPGQHVVQHCLTFINY